MSRGFLGGKQIIIELQMQEIIVEFVYSRQQKIKNFSYNKDDNGKSWVEVIIVTTLDAVVTVDVLPANNNDVNASLCSKEN